ncbi:MAG TPA: TetR/AcrR family transcriptional regulator [Phenylobacterium sp.]|nr:TetR/AcrR family transcriptional regulator [Phenylobacterium sp.]
MAGGRPRAFDADEALDRALEVFWRQGYEGTALSDLTAAMGINRPSLYATFGNKEALFRKVLDRYADGPAAFAARALELPRARDVVEALVYGAIELTTGPDTPLGCINVRTAQACGPEADPARHEAMTRRAADHAALCSRLRRARAEGDLPPGADPDALAEFVTTFMDGIAVQASGGTSRAQLRRAAAIALCAWPAPSPGDGL